MTIILFLLHPSNIMKIFIFHITFVKFYICKISIKKL
jgi:hypothetical protein